MDRIQLPYTLQTWAGMVTNNGLPAAQYPNHSTKAHQALDEHEPVTLPLVGDSSHGHLRKTMHRLHLTDDWRITSFQDYIETDWFSPKHACIPQTVTSCLTASCIPNKTLIRATSPDKDRFVANVNACRNPKTDIHRLMTLIKNRTRLNLEQAAAAVVSALVNHDRLHDAALLVRELTGVLAASHMSEGWEGTDVSRNTLAKSRAEAFAHAAARAQLLCSKAVERRGELVGEPPRNYHDFVVLLLRIRSVRPSTKDRCLFIPRWMFEEAGIEPAGGHAEYLDEYQARLRGEGREDDVLRGYKFPEDPAGDDSIVLSKHSFRTLQRCILRLYRFLDPVARLTRRVRELEDRVLYASAWIDRQLRETDDVAKVAFWFFAYQRRLQLKVVSDDQWTRFLARGEGKLLYQNSVRMKSTFEEALAEIAGLGLDSLATAGSEDTLGLIDETCLLMREYVNVYGQGKKENLVFQKGISGGKGRGAVDQYNMLCVILRDLKLRAKEEGIEDLPGPVFKFLAKDIMHWNKSWDDDAFVNNKVHGWEEWVVKRGLV
ncbi:hypothetical protein NKR19_g5243 [Coniochaeta hoffmannii]|uniref:Uncharacterized protein n=1 Tax=Coniochaeta hoffmannii TaxID=91930 RepID=A0AA38S4K6_9PEZI|nr:hypothetical protein NKR19_g5243 [Coniochaeta hoffmannii]